MTLRIGSFKEFNLKIANYNSFHKKFIELYGGFCIESSVSIEFLNRLLEASKFSIQAIDKIKLKKSEFINFLSRLDKETLPAEIKTVIASIEAEFQIATDAQLEKIRFAAKVCFENIKPIYHGLLLRSQRHETPLDYRPTTLLQDLFIKVLSVSPQGHYETVLNSLGAGSFATVSRVHFSYLQQEFAKREFKAIAPMGASSLRIRNSILDSIDSKHLMKPVFAFRGSDYYPLGKADLKKHLQEPFSKSNFFDYIRDLILGLRDLERESLVHQDLKPANVIVTEDRRALISDLDSLVEEGGKASAGTPYYLSPERAADGFSSSTSKLKASHKFDIWSLGQLIYSSVSSYPHILVSTGEKLSMMEFIMRLTLSTQSMIDEKIAAIESHKINFMYPTEDVSNLIKEQFTENFSEILRDGQRLFCAKKGLDFSTFLKNFSALPRDVKETRTQEFIVHFIESFSKELDKVHISFEEYLFREACTRLSLSGRLSLAPEFDVNESAFRIRHILRACLQIEPEDRLNASALYRWFVVNTPQDAHKMAQKMQRMIRGFFKRKKENTAAVMIQKIFKGYNIRKLYLADRIEA